MELHQFLLIVKKRIAFIVGIPVAMGIITAIVSIFVISPSYEASATLYITNQKTATSEEEVTYEEVLTNQKLVKDYREIIKSKLITKAVIDELKLNDLTSDTLSSRITVESINDTSVLEIRVKDNSAARAMKITNKICEVFIEKATALLKINNISIVDSAEEPNGPISPKPLRLIMISFLISMFICLGIFYFIELLNETIKTSEDIETILGLNVLGTIPLFNMK